MAIASNLGFPRIGVKRELKRAVERFWSGKIDLDEMEATAATLRRRHWELQRDAGIDHIPSNDFSLYDQVLDTVAMVGAVPARYGWTGETVDRATYFAMARGSSDVPAMEMTKWFDTNYHYIVPEFERGQTFRLGSAKPADEFEEAKALGIQTRPVLLGPISFLLLGKSRDDEVQPLDLLDALMPVYEEVLRNLAAAGAEWVQIDEPILALDQPQNVLSAFQSTYSQLASASPSPAADTDYPKSEIQNQKSPRICLATYFGDLRGNLDVALQLPVAALHLDLVRGPRQLDRALDNAPESLMLSLGVVNGRNIWRADLDRALATLEKATATLGPDRILIGPSCSLLHCPLDLNEETELDDDLRGWLAFARQKVDEIAVLARAINEGRDLVAAEFADSRAWIERKRQSTRVHKQQVKQRVAAIDESMLRRNSPYPERRARQSDRLSLPPLPTTTIGSFPQTPEVRKARAAHRKGESTVEQYEKFLEEETERTIRFQEEIGIDVLVHGEFERNDMVEYFGEQLEGLAFTRNGWVQSYGSRCVKPPIIFGDVSRPQPMTVRWSQFAQSLTDRPMKGMLTGPITILQWSFVRDDQPRCDTAVQIALAIRDEVADLEAAGIRIIQIDEPALREGLPLHRDEWGDYLDWAVKAFRITSSGVGDETQIHTHMCYSEFNDIIESIAALDADVISIEASRSDMELLRAFGRFHYPNEIGPGVYDIHSPRVPSADEMAGQLRKALDVLRPEQLWVNPDCGLKTRGWPEVRDALANMVQAAKTIRATM